MINERRFQETGLTSESFDEHVYAFVTVFVPTGGEHLEGVSIELLSVLSTYVDGIFEIEIQSAVEMTSDEFVNFSF